MPALLELDHVGLSYHTLAGEIPALSQISFSIQEGEFVSLVGPSGCGKSTVLNLIAGLLTPEQGQITLQGLPREHSVLSIGYMLQKDHLFEWLTIYENVLLGLEIQKKKSKKRPHMWTVSYRSTVSGTSVRLILRSFPAGCGSALP